MLDEFPAAVMCAFKGGRQVPRQPVLLPAACRIARPGSRAGDGRFQALERQRRISALLGWLSAFHICLPCLPRRLPAPQWPPETPSYLRHSPTACSAGRAPHASRLRLLRRFIVTLSCRNRLVQ